MSAGGRWLLHCKTCTRRLADAELERRRCAACEARIARRRQLAERIAECRNAPPPRRTVRLYERLNRQELLRDFLANALTERKEKSMAETIEERLDDYAREYAAKLREYFRAAARVFNRSSVVLGDEAEYADDLILQQLHDLLLEIEPEIFEEVARLRRRSEATKAGQRKRKEQ